MVVCRHLGNDDLQDPKKTRELAGTVKSSGNDVVYAARKTSANASFLCKCDGKGDLRNPRCPKGEPSALILCVDITSVDKREGSI